MPQEEESLEERLEDEKPESKPKKQVEPKPQEYKPKTEYKKPEIEGLSAETAMIAVMIAIVLAVGGFVCGIDYVVNNYLPDQNKPKPVSVGKEDYKKEKKLITPVEKEIYETKK